jgi:hypothetical protein
MGKANKFVKQCCDCLNTHGILRNLACAQTILVYNALYSLRAGLFETRTGLKHTNMGIQWPSWTIGKSCKRFSVCKCLKKGVFCLLKMIL